MFNTRPDIASFARKNPREDATFSLLPRTAPAHEVLYRNRWLVSRIIDPHGQPTYGLNIGTFLRAQSGSELVAFGRGRSADVAVEGEDVSRTHFTFDLVRSTGAIILRDHSTWRTTQTFETSGNDVYEMERGRVPRRVMVSRDFNLTIGFGSQHRFKFQLIWHQDQQVSQPLYRNMEDPILARTIGEAPMVTIQPTCAPTGFSTPALQNDSSRIRWVQKGMLGSGSFGKVYSAWDVDSGELFAVKVVAVQSDGERAALQREISTLARISHRNIVEYRGGQFGPRTCHPPTYEIFTELKDGNAHDLFGAESMDNGIASHMFHEMLQALDYLEYHNIIHRDIKPDNILFKRDPLQAEPGPESYTFQLADFGVAKVVNNTGTHAGSPLYMAPEINPATNHEGYPQTPAADIWSLLVTILFALNKGRIRDHSLRSYNDVITRVQKIATQHLPDLQQMVDRDPGSRPSAEVLLDRHFQGQGKVPREKKVMLVRDNNLASLHETDDSGQKPDDAGTAVRHNHHLWRLKAQKFSRKRSTRQRQPPVEEMGVRSGRTLRARSAVKYTS